MIKLIFNKIFSKKSKSDNLAEETNSETNKFIGFIHNIIKNISLEFKTIHQKSKNLLETNYQLGLDHIKRGNLKDARFRFAIIIKFWPNFYEAYYQKAYVETLLNKPFDAQQTIEKFEINTKEPLNEKFLNLKKQIELAINNQLANEENNLKN